MGLRCVSHRQNYVRDNIVLSQTKLGQFVNQYLFILHGDYLAIGVTGVNVIVWGVLYFWCHDF